MDEELRFTYLSDRFFEIVPIRNEDIIGKRHDELAANLTNDEAWRLYFHDVATRRPFSDFVYAISLPDRTTKYLVINGKPIFDSGGNFKGYRGTGSDKTARAAAQTALDQTERQFRDLIEGSIQGLYIYRDGRVLFANQALADILGYETPEEILALEKIERFLGPADEDRHSHRKPGRRTGEFEPEFYEARAIKKDASETWLEFREMPVEWHDQPAMQCVVVDITERKRAEAALQQQTEELEQILRNVPRAVITIDVNGFITTFNPAATDTFGYSSDEIIGRNISLLMSTDVANLHDGYVKAYLQSGVKKFIDNGPRQLTARHKDGREFPMELAISQAGTGENGAVFVGVARDITEQIEAQSTLERHNEELRKRDEDLHEQNKRFNAALENMSDGLCMFDSEKRLIVSNARYASMYNVLPEQIAPGATLREIIDLRVANDTYEENDAETYIEERQEWVDSGAKELNVRKLKDERIIGISHQSMPDGGWLSTHVDITELREVQDQLSYLAHHDALTELPNRTLLLDRINDALTRTRRKRGFALLVLDLDGFKGVNDMLGHPAGDKLLRAAAERLRGCVREIDTVARLGGDEFAIVLTSTNRLEDVEALSGRICVELGAPFTMEDDRQVVVGASVGIAMAPTDGRDVNAGAKSCHWAAQKLATLLI
jgi:diguanylate cyclase (GGDEF)-like protein/PAS domain S-box-containing protein